MCQYDFDDYCPRDLTLFDVIDPAFTKHTNYHKNNYSLVAGGFFYEYSRLDPSSNVTCGALSWDLSCHSVCNYAYVCHSNDYCNFYNDENNEKNVICGPKIERLIAGDQWDVVQDPYSITLVAQITKYEINLRCHLTSESTFGWLVDDDRSASGVVSWEKQTIKMELNEMENSEQWKSFLTVGLKFTCIANNKNPYTISANTTVTLRGIQTVEYGESQPFFCSPEKNETFVWKIDGKIDDEKTKNEENITFRYNHPKRVFIECGDTNGINLARFTMDVCAIEKTQQGLRYYTMTSIPIIFATLTLSTLTLPQILTTARSKEPKNSMVETQALLATKKATIILGLQLLLLPLYSSFSFLMDVMTDYMAFITYLLTGHPYFGLATLGLISFSSIVTSTVAATSVFFNGEKSRDYEPLTKSKFRRFFSYFLMYCNLGPILIQFQLFFTNLEILKLTRLGKMIPFDLRMKQERIVKLLKTLAICELVCESLGQGILQAYILSQQLGRDDICLPPQGTMHWNMTRKDTDWLEETGFISYDTQSGEKGFDTGCTCENWIATGADHCYHSDFLGERGNELINLKCYIADCSTTKYKFSIIFPFIQVISSLLQISFALTHLGAVKNLQHVESLTRTLKKVIFYFLTYFYFITSLFTALLLSTYLAYNGNGLWQMLAFLCVFRLILPETTSARKYLAPWLVRVLTILLPLIAYIPFYYLLWLEAQNESSCMEMVRNRITVHMRKDKALGQDIAAYYATADQAEATVINYLRNSEFFPLSLKAIENDANNKLPNSTDEAVFNFRNSFNVFGHFFLWTGWLVMADAIIMSLFLIYWIFVVRSFQTVPNMNKLVNRMTGKMSLSFMNSESPVAFAAAAASTGGDNGCI